MKRIPKSLQLLGHTVTISVVSQRDWDALVEDYPEIETTCGWWLPDKNRIVLLRQPHSQLLHSFFHELMHAVLYYTDIDRAYDEAYVDRLGGLFAQAMETSR